MASAGRILIMPKGNYNAETEYQMLDLVFNGGSSWVAKKTVKGIEPTDDSAEHWMKMCESVDLIEIIQRIAALEAQMLGTISLDDIDLSAYATKTELNSINTSLGTRLGAAESKVTTLTSDVDTAKSNITNLQTLVSGMSGGVKIASGSYTGGGYGGSSSPNSLTFEFEPKVVFFENGGNVYGCPIIWHKGVTLLTLALNGSNSSKQLVFEQNGKTLKWYYPVTEANPQLNTQGTVYHWVAIG